MYYLVVFGIMTLLLLSGSLFMKDCYFDNTYDIAQGKNNDAMPGETTIETVHPERSPPLIFRALKYILRV